MAITTRAFGTTQDGQNVTMYTLTNQSGASVSMLDLGAIVTNILVPDKSGKLTDVALGFDTLAHYEGGHGAMGDTIGRFANRIGGGCFTLDGTEYHLYQNDGENTLHGGKAGFQKKVWQATPVAGDTVDSVKFHYVSADMEENFPGNLTADVTISWDDDCNLTFHYQATTDKATVINMTNHTYFNLAGYDHGTVRDHAIYIDSDVVTAVDSGLIPTGGYMPVSQTPLDLREEMLIGDGLDCMNECVPMRYAKGYDCNYVLRKGSAMGLCACVHHEESGRRWRSSPTSPACSSTPPAPPITRMARAECTICPTPVCAWKRSTTRMRRITRISRRRRCVPAKSTTRRPSTPSASMRNPK